MLDKESKLVIKELEENCFSGDKERNHSVADDILCVFLSALGYKEVVAKYKTIGKWYA